MAANELAGKLSAVQVKQAKPRGKTYKLTDGHGLNLEVRSTGSKYWRMSYRYQHKQRTLALGVYPVITLADARSLALDAKRLLVSGIDPSTHKKQNKVIAGNSTFEPVAKKWHSKESGRWSEGHAKDVWQTIEDDVLPYLANMPIRDIRTSDVLYVVQKVEERGALDVAGRIKQRISSIFRYAIQMGYAEFNPADALKDVIKTRKVEHRKSLKQDQLPVYLNALDDYRGHLSTRYALQMITYTFVRPGELRSAEWEDFDLKKGIWRIPAEKMKMKEEHIVPLASQVVELLESVKALTGGYDLVFPGSHDFSKPMSENTLTYAIRKRLGFDATAHGFRTTASTILNESGYRVDVIERQLAHGERNKVRAAYNRSQYLAERTGMMQWYADYLAGLKAGADVVLIGSKA